MKKLARYVSAGITTAVIGTVGLATAASATTSPPYNNYYTSWNTYNTKVNTNVVSVNNSNFQKAYTGNATVKYNLFAGGASSGAATNLNSPSTNIFIYNH